MPDNSNRARDHLANERTFLAWVRTGVATIVFGFAVGRFSIALQEFITGGPRFGCQQSALKEENWALSLEFRLSKDWRLAGSVEPVRGCSAAGATPGANQRQAGADVLWELNY